LGARLFITGASGYIGRHVVAAAAAAGIPMTLLVRDPTSLPSELGEPGPENGVEVVRGELAQPDVWQQSIQAGDVVLHLAAATGKARAEEHTRVNVEGTRAVAEAAAARGAKHLVLVSSIAVRFPDQAHYPYAHAKAEAERCVRESQLPWTIVRPAIVVGPDAPVLQGFALLASLPITPVFGAGQREIQPIDVGDLAHALVDLCADPPTGATLEFGGPERLTIDAWMHRIRAAHGAGPARIWHLPLVPIRAFLALIEPLLLPVLPLTAGQLATFANDSVAEPSSFMDARASSLQSLDVSLAPRPRERRPPAPFDESRLSDECRWLCDHLVGMPATPAVIAGYLAHHKRHPVGPFSAFEEDLVAYACRGRLQAAMADAYSARFLSDGLLRRKLILILALLETDRETFAIVDAPDSGGGFSAWAGLIRRGLAEVGLALAATLWLGPRHLLLGRGGDG
jgi:NADH dehydrogenase